MRHYPNPALPTSQLPLSGDKVTGDYVSADQNNRLKLRLMLAKPRGFCAGVDRAVQIVERALEKYGAPVYVRHEMSIMHA